jgi:transcriptional regulator with XRE-family HTH domain
MNHRRRENYLSTHRKRTGLSQEEMGMLLGYQDVGHVSRHERSKTIPPLATALAYEVIFRVPVATIFAGMHESIRQEIESKLRDLEVDLGNRSAGDRHANRIAQKLVWLNERKSR